MARAKKAAAKARSGVQPMISVEFDYAEASMLVVAVKLLFGAAAGRDGPDAETTRTLNRLLHKLYRAEPRLKADARRVEDAMRDFLINELGTPGDDEVEVEVDAPPLKGANLLPVVIAAMDEGRAVPLMRRDGVFDFFPTGIGEIGDVAVAIGWSAAHGDYTVIRMDQVLGVGLERSAARPAAADPAAGTLARLCPEPRA